MEIIVSHASIATAESILNQKFPVLDHGFIRLIDYMGGDQRVVDSARISYGEESKGEEQDRKLINYLMRNQHTSPFENVVFQFHIKMPIFVARQWVRHRTGRVSEISARYTHLNYETYLPDTTRFQTQDVKSKQCSSGVPIDEAVAQGLRLEMEDFQRMLGVAYDNYIEKHDMAKELARINLPLATYTEWYWQMDLHNLLHFLKLRLDPHAQLEIREYGKVLADMVRAVAPISYEAFEEHILFAKKFSRTEVDKLKQLYNHLDAEGKQLFFNLGV
jgi:thymidylate synthase (FAD)